MFDMYVCNPGFATIKTTEGLISINGFNRSMQLSPSKWSWPTKNGCIYIYADFNEQWRVF